MPSAARHILAISASTRISRDVGFVPPTEVALLKQYLFGAAPKSPSFGMKGLTCEQLNRTPNSGAARIVKEVQSCLLYWRRMNDQISRRGNGRVGRARSCMTSSL
jgi:hypothetical protein